ncbi:energy transducer TonB [Massilia genomosp. 1]|uniref:energy transducer TonB n=1 Tax=Massilia genomosp. 1 TaxID=2609280 RepID=UPI00141D89D4
MIKSIYRVAAVLVTLLAAVTGRAQEAAGELYEPSLIGCQTPQWVPEAMRYELEGSTVLSYEVDDRGRPASIRIARSSGWKIVDQMSIRTLSSCRYEVPAGPQAVPARLRKAHDWALRDNGQAPSPAALVEGSCQASALFGGFTPFTRKVIARDDAMLVRFLLDEAGKPFGIKFEESDPARVSAASAFIESCRFTPATVAGRAVRGNLYGWLSLK